MLDVATNKQCVGWVRSASGEEAAGSFWRVLKDLRLRGDHKDCITVHRGCCFTDER